MKKITKKLILAHALAGLLMGGETVWGTEFGEIGNPLHEKQIPSVPVRPAGGLSLLAQIGGGGFSLKKTQKAAPTSQQTTILSPFEEFSKLPSQPNLHAAFLKQEREIWEARVLDLLQPWIEIVEEYSASDRRKSNGKRKSFESFVKRKELTKPASFELLTPKDIQSSLQNRKITDQVKRLIELISTSIFHTEYQGRNMLRAHNYAKSIFPNIIDHDYDQICEIAEKVLEKTQLIAKKDTKKSRRSSVGTMYLPTDVLSKITSEVFEAIDAIDFSSSNITSIDEGSFKIMLLNEIISNIHDQEKTPEALYFLVSYLTYRKNHLNWGNTTLEEQAFDMLDSLSQENKEKLYKTLFCHHDTLRNSPYLLKKSEVIPLFIKWIKEDQSAEVVAFRAQHAKDISSLNSPTKEASMMNFCFKEQPPLKSLFAEHWSQYLATAQKANFLLSILKEDIILDNHHSTIEDLHKMRWSGITLEVSELKKQSFSAQKQIELMQFILQSKQEWFDGIWIEHQQKTPFLKFFEIISSPAFFDLALSPVVQGLESKLTEILITLENDNITYNKPESSYARNTSSQIKKIKEERLSAKESKNRQGLYQHRKGLITTLSITEQEAFRTTIKHIITNLTEQNIDFYAHIQQNMKEHYPLYLLIKILELSSSSEDHQIQIDDLCLFDTWTQLLNDPNAAYGQIEQIKKEILDAILNTTLANNILSDKYWTKVEKEIEENFPAARMKYPQIQYEISLATAKEDIKPGFFSSKMTKLGGSNRSTYLKNYIKYLLDNDLFHSINRVPDETEEERTKAERSEKIGWKNILKFMSTTQGFLNTILASHPLSSALFSEEIFPETKPTGPAVTTSHIFSHFHADNIYGLKPEYVSLFHNLLSRLTLPSKQDTPISYDMMHKGFDRFKRSIEQQWNAQIKANESRAFEELDLVLTNTIYNSHDVFYGSVNSDEFTEAGENAFKTAYSPYVTTEEHAGENIFILKTLFNTLIKEIKAAVELKKKEAISSSLKQQPQTEVKNPNHKRSSLGGVSMQKRKSKSPVPVKSPLKNAASAAKVLKLKSKTTSVVDPQSMMNELQKALTGRKKSDSPVPGSMSYSPFSKGIPLISNSEGKKRLSLRKSLGATPSSELGSGRKKRKSVQSSTDLLMDYTGLGTPKLSDSSTNYDASMYDQVAALTQVNGSNSDGKKKRRKSNAQSTIDNGIAPSESEFKDTSNGYDASMHVFESVPLSVDEAAVNSGSKKKKRKSSGMLDGAVMTELEGQSSINDGSSSFNGNGLAPSNQDIYASATKSPNKRKADSSREQQHEDTENSRKHSTIDQMASRIKLITNIVDLINIFEECKALNNDKTTIEFTHKLAHEMTQQESVRHSLPTMLDMMRGLNIRGTLDTRGRNNRTLILKTNSGASTSATQMTNVDGAMALIGSATDVITVIK